MQIEAHSVAFRCGQRIPHVSDLILALRAGLEHPVMRSGQVNEGVAGADSIKNGGNRELGGIHHRSWAAHCAGLIERLHRPVIVASSNAG